MIENRQGLLPRRYREKSHVDTAACRHSFHKGFEVGGKGMCYLLHVIIVYSQDTL